MQKDEKIHWDEKYRIGLREIDSQHKKLFMLVNKLYDLNDQTATKEEIRSILYDFSNYTQTHFKEEEDFMDSIGYDRLQEHKQQHQHLIESLSLITKNPATLSVIKSKMRVIAKRVLLNHIIKEDIKIKDFMDNNEIKMEIIDCEEIE